MSDKVKALSTPLVSSPLLVLVLSAWLGTGYASDFIRELAYQQVLLDSQVGERISLEAGGQKFVGLYTEAQKNPDKNAVLILHDLGAYPDQQSVIHELRAELPMHQWASLSLQMPIREAGAAFEDYYALFPEALLRIQAGVDFLAKNGFKNVVLAGYGLGSLMAAYAQTEQNLAVKALVLISLPVPVTDHKEAQIITMLKKIKLPVLDVYAENDPANVTVSAGNRRLAAKANGLYRQLRLEGEDHSFQHENGLLIKRIYSWLTRVTFNTDAQ